jgi:hypothetical protein
MAPACCSELRLKDIERVQKHLDGVKALEKRGLSKEQKEELVICQKVLDWLQSGKDVRWAGCLFTRVVMRSPFAGMSIKHVDAVGEHGDPAWHNTKCNKEQAYNQVDSWNKQVYGSHRGINALLQKLACDLLEIIADLVTGVWRKQTGWTVIPASVGSQLYTSST